MMMRSFLVAAFGLLVSAQNIADMTFLRFSCSQLVTERLDPIVSPGILGSAHLHQIVGGNAFNATMPSTNDVSTEATGTSCTFSEDFSNYWTPVLYFKAANGTYKRVQQQAGVGFFGANGGTTIYYVKNTANETVTAFKPGFRMVVGNPTYRNASAAASNYGSVYYTCMQNSLDRTNTMSTLPNTTCPAGILSSFNFPTCWDGVNVDSTDHKSHVSYPMYNFQTGGLSCPSTHPVSIPMVFYEVVWDTTPFNDPSIWPTEGQPFVWSHGDFTGYGGHADYLFGWKGDSLQQAMDASCNITCPQLTTQSTTSANKITVQAVVNETIDGWLTELPGGMSITGPTPTWASVAAASTA